MEKYFVYQEAYLCTQIDGKNTVLRNKNLESKIAAGNPSSDIEILFYVKLVT